MVAHLLGLKLQLVTNSLRRSPAALIGMALGMLYALGLLMLAIAGLIGLRVSGSVPQTALVLTLVGSGVVVAWALVPVLLYGVDPTLDPARFAVYAIAPRTLAVGLAVSGVVGIPGMATLLVLAFVPVAVSVSLAGVLAGVVCAACGLATCILLSRVLTTAAAGLLQSRRGRDIVAAAGFVALLLVVPALNTASRGSGWSPQVLRSTADVLGWTPFGWAWAGAGDVALGHLGTGVVRLVLAVALVVALFALWERQVRASVLAPRGIGGQSTQRAQEGTGMFARLPEGPGWAVAARSLTYWRRDPRFSFPAIITCLFPLALLVPGLSGSDLALLAMPVLGGYLLGWGQHNDVGYDSTPFWLHVAGGLSGTSDRLGRLVPPAVLGLLLLPTYSVLGSGLADRWDMLPAQVGLTLCLILSGFGVSSVASAFRPYAVPAPGESPFATPPGATGLTVVIQLVCGMAIAVPCLPVLGLSVAAYLGTGWASWAALATGGVLGAVMLGAGLRLGARLFDQRAPELLQSLVRAR